MQVRTGAAILVEALERLGVEIVFGVPGTQTVSLFDVLRRSRLRTVVATHELGAGFMANGYARATGRVGVLSTIPGPGFTYALTALAEARHDSAALLHIVPALCQNVGHAFPLQAVDQVALAEPLVKRVLRIERVAEIPAGIAAGHVAAVTGEPGPVLVEVAASALGAETDVAIGATDLLMKDSASASPDPAVLARQVAARLLRARRPIILAGQGAMGGAGGLRRLAEALCCPVATTLSGRGVLPEDHPLSLSVDMGGYGLTVLNEALDSADLVLVLGCKLTHNGTGGFQLRLDPKRCLRVDASPEVIGATLQDAESLLGDVQRVLEALLQHHGDSLAPCAGWSAGEVAQLRARARSGAEGPEPRIAGLHPSTPAAFFEDVRAAIPRDTVVVTDSGLHQTLVRRYWKVLAPRGLITPSDFQSMGFGIPAALGARLGGGNRPVVAIAGDGGFHMAGLELLTAVRDRIPVTVIVFNDGYLGTIRLQQLAEFGHAHGVRLATPDYAGFAAAIGADYSLAGAEPGSVVARAVASNRVTLIEVRLGDSWGIHAARGRALFTGTARRVIPSRIRRWLRRRRS